MEAAKQREDARREEVLARTARDLRPPTPTTPTTPTTPATLRVPEAIRLDTRRQSVQKASLAAKLFSEELGERPISEAQAAELMCLTGRGLTLNRRGILNQAAMEQYRREGFDDDCEIEADVDRTELESSASLGI